MSSTTKQTVFVREATGLVRDLNWFFGMIMGLAYFNIAVASFLIFGLGSYLFPGSNMVISIGLIGFLIDLPIVIAYSFFSASMPRSGGDYIYVSRTFGGAVGFAVGIVFFVFLSIFSVGQNAWFATSTVISPGLAAIGSTSGNTALVSLSQTVTHTIPTLAIGLSLLVVTFLLLLTRTSILYKVVLGLFVIAFLGYPILFTIVVGSGSNAKFISAFNQYAATNGLNVTYSSIISSAQSQGASILAPTFAASVAALPIIYATLAFPQSATYVGGETKRASRQVPLALITGLALNCGVTAIMGIVTYNTFGYNFISATAWLGLSPASHGNPLLTSPYTDYFLAILNPNAALNWFMLISGVAWELLLMVTFGLMGTRAIFAFSFDRLMPRWFADVNERFHTPIKATILTVFGGLVFLYLSTLSFLGTYDNSIVAWTSGYLIVMIAALAFPFLRKSLFSSAPSFARSKLGGLPLMSLFGALGAIAVGIVFYYLILDPSVSGFTTTGITVITIVYVIAVVAYFGARAYRKSHGIDVALAFKEIPPE
jgi:APA family basic amino acid/polyamine antiporter